jgi:hypothetical protein
MSRLSFSELGFCLAGIIACALLAWRLTLRDASAVRWARVWRLPSDERGAIQSLSFVLTLPVFVMLMLFIVQLAQLTIARIFVEYAAYAAARSAAVWIPANLDDLFESANRVGMSRQSLGMIQDENGHPYDRYLLMHPSRKLRRIEQAAAQALMPICPSRNVGASETTPGIDALPALENAYRTFDPVSVNNSRIPTRLRNKLAYALAATTVELQVRHKDTEPPLMWHDIGPYSEEFEPNEIGWQDQLLLTVRHDFALLPGPARFLAKRTIAPGNVTDPTAARIVQRRNVFVYPLQATVRLSSEGEKSVIPYIHRM